METCGTTHLTMNEFAEEMAEAEPGKPFVYALGDLAFSCDEEKINVELRGLRAMAWSAYYERGEILLMQRRLPDVPFRRTRHASFQYLAMKPRAEHAAFWRDAAKKRPKVWKPPALRTAREVA